jgi:TonB-linked SusC/RagA family outer membrane protein
MKQAPRIYAALLVIVTLLSPALCAHARESGQTRDTLQTTYKINLNILNATVRDITNEISRQTGITFSYESSLDRLPVGDVSVKKESIDLDELLGEVFGKSGISYKAIGRAVVLAQGHDSGRSRGKHTVKGYVTDSDGMPVSGAIVTLKGTTKGVLTGEDGSYSIEAWENSVLRFTSMRYEDHQEDVGARRVVNVEMSALDNMIEPIVILGYGTYSQRKVSSAIATLEGDEIRGAPVNSVGEALKGRIPGLLVATTNWQPGSNPKFLIRGGSSVNLSQDPVILVDGVEREINGLNPNDIESIEVLKDAASSAIYGARASNGVILISTRRGSLTNAPQIMFESQWAFSSPATKFDLMDGGRYLSVMRPAILEAYCGGADPYVILNGAESAGTGNAATSRWTPRYLGQGEQVPAGYKWMYDPIAADKVIIYQDNYQQGQWFGNAFWQNYYMGINGGSRKFRYAASVGYTDDGGIGIATGYSRMTFHGNTSFRITRKLEATTIVDYSRIGMQSFSGTNLNLRNSVIRGLSTPPTHRDWYDAEAGEELVGTPALGINNTTIPAAYYKYYYDNSGDTEKRTGINVNLVWDVLPGLKAVALYGMNNRHKRSWYYIKDNATTSPYVRPAKEGYSETTRNNVQFYVNYTKQLGGGHNLDATAGHDRLYTDYNSLDAKVDGADSDKIPTLNAGTNSQSGYPRNTRTREVLLSYFGRLNYDYRGKYIASFTMRADGSSKFAKGNYWGYFPAASLAWMVSEEGFWKSRAVESLKLRLSYGLTGNNGIGLYDAYGSYTSLYVYNDHATTILEEMPNSNLTWETTSQLNLGVDVSMPAKRIDVTLDLYNKVTRNLLFSIQLPNTSGINDVLENVGSVRFYGLDFGLSTVNIRDRNFSWTTAITYNYNMNSVLKLAANGNDRNRIGGITYGDGMQFGGLAEGERMGRIYGYKVDHIIENEVQAEAAMYDMLSRGYRRSDRSQVPGRKDVGDYEWVNRLGSTTADGTDIINEEDQFLLGYAVPHSTGGIRNTFNYKNWSLDIQLDYALGHSITNSIYSRFFTATMGNGNHALAAEVARTWKSPGDETPYARFTVNDSDWGNRNYSRTSDVFVQKGDYLCLRDISLSYSLPQSVLRKVRIKEVKFTVSGNTLHYFTAVTGVSPEAATTGQLYSAAATYDTNYNPYPPTRKVLFGVKLTF